MNCKHCGSANCYENGFGNGKQNRKCEDCGRNFTEGDNRRTDRAKEKVVCFPFYPMGKASMRFLADIFQVSVRTIQVWTEDMADSTPDPAVGTEIEEIEIDEMWPIFKKTRKLWTLEAFGRVDWRTVARVAGRRNIATLRRRYDK